jgi:hypothetical protein
MILFVADIPVEKNWAPEEHHKESAQNQTFHQIPNFVRILRDTFNYRQCGAGRKLCWLFLS